MGAKTDFCRAVTVLIDTREKEYAHITDGLDALGVVWRREKLSFGDLSFEVAGRSFAEKCAVERKADADELYGNLMEKVRGAQENRLEKEVAGAAKEVNQFVLLLEGVASMEALRSYQVPDWKMKAAPQRIKADIGEMCYSRIRAWQCANRYNLRVECVPDKGQTVARVLEIFYYYYHNYRALVAPRR